MAREALEAAIATLGLTMTAEFVPWSKSRNAGEKHRSLNWRVTVLKAGRPVLTTDYGAGVAHCPAYNASIKELGHATSITRAAAIAFETETGFPALATAGGMIGRKNTTRIVPDFCDVLYSLASDSDVLDYGTFEEWASMLGYGPDSRKAEATYRACLEIGLKLRNGIGEAGITLLREAGEDY